MILETASDDKHSKMEYDKFLCPQARASASWFCTSVRQHYCHPMTISVSNNAASSASGARIVSYSSQAPGCGASNVLDQNPGKLWLTSSASNLPQHVVIELAREPGINLKTFGWFCWHAYSTNPGTFTFPTMHNSMSQVRCKLFCLKRHRFTRAIVPHYPTSWPLRAQLQLNEMVMLCLY